MIMLTCLSLIVGAALGQRQTVFILIPAIACTLVVIAACSMAAGLELWMTGLTLMLTVIGLQLGYLAGAAIQVVAARYRLFPAGEAGAGNNVVRLAMTGRRTG